MLPRILTSILLLFSVLFLPFWLSVSLAILGIIYFSNYFEGIVIFLIFDLLYGVKEGRFFGFYFVSVFAALLFLTIVELIKKKIRIS